MKKINIFIRFVLLLSPFLVPWWFVGILSLAALFFFNFYWEIVLIGIILDIIYATSFSYFGMYIFTIGSLLSFWAISHIKQRLIVY